MPIDDASNQMRCSAYEGCQEGVSACGHFLRAVRPHRPRRFQIRFQFMASSRSSPLGVPRKDT